MRLHRACESKLDCGELTWPELSVLSYVPDSSATVEMSRKTKSCLTMPGPIIANIERYRFTGSRPRDVLSIEVAV